MSVTDKQQQYLHAMGIDTWTLRAAQQAPQPLAQTTEPDAVLASVGVSQSIGSVAKHDIVQESALPAESVPEPGNVVLSDAVQPDIVSSEIASPEIIRPEIIPPEAALPETIPFDAAGLVGGYNWGQLQAAVKKCVACDLHRTRKNTVFGVGDSNADWMIIGEAPGADEDQQGEPFVGRAGQLLNKMLQAIGLSRQQVFIANILKCRPPNNRDPRPEEVLQCSAYLRRQVELVKPNIILAVGRIAAQQLLKTDSSLAQMRGKCFDYNHASDGSEAPSGHSGNGTTPVIVTYHPAYLLRSPGEKRKAWQDLLFAQAVAQRARNQGIND